MRWEAWGGKSGLSSNVIASTTSSAGAWARGFHGDLGSAAAASASTTRITASASAAALHCVTNGSAAGGGASTFAEVVVPLPLGGRHVMMGGYGGVGVERFGPAGRGGNLHSSRSFVGWSTGQRRLASGGGRGWFGFGGGGGKENKGEDGGATGGSGQAAGGPSGDFDAIGATSKAATAAGSNGADGGASTMDAAMQGGGGIVAGTASAAMVNEAINPASMADPTVVGEVLSIAGESWATTAGLMYLIEYFHLSHDLEWWSAIVATTLLMRVVTIPLTVMQQRNAAKLHLAKPEIEALNQLVKQNQHDPDQLKEHQARIYEIWKKYDCNPVKMFVPLLVQAPLFISFYFAISRMSEGLPSFRDGGDFWFTDLSAADPTYILPLLSAGTFLLSIELGGAAGAMGGGGPAAEDDPSQKTMKWFMRGLGVAMVPLTASFPSGVFVYWVTTNLFSFAQMMALKVPNVKKLAGIPDIPTGPVAAAAKPSVVGKWQIEKKFGASPQLHSSKPKVRTEGRHSIDSHFSSVSS